MCLASTALCRFKLCLEYWQWLWTVCRLVEHGFFLSQVPWIEKVILKIKFIIDSRFTLICLVTCYWFVANSAAAAGGIVFFLSYLPFSVLYPRYGTLSLTTKLSSCLDLNLAMSFGMVIIGKFEGAGGFVELLVCFEYYFMVATRYLHFYWDCCISKKDLRINCKLYWN